MELQGPTSPLLGQPPQVPPGGLEPARTLASEKNSLAKPSSSSLLPGEGVKGHIILFRKLTKRSSQSSKPMEVDFPLEEALAECQPYPPLCYSTIGSLFAPWHFPPSNMTFTVPIPQPPADHPSLWLEQAPTKQGLPLSCAWPGKGPCTQ